MRRVFGVLIFNSLFCASVFAQNTSSIQCDPGSTGPIPAWTAPQSPWVVEYLKCGQMVTIVGLEQGYVKVQIGERIAYVEAKYVESSGTQEPKIVEPVYQSKEYQKQEPPNETQQPEPSVPPAEEVTQQPEPSAAPTAETPQPHAQRKPRRHQTELAFEVSNIYYDEPNIMRNKGFMWGVSGDYTYRPNNFVFRLDGRLSLGNVDYWSNGTGTAEGLRDYNFETRFSFGYDLKAPSRKAVFTPYMGFGYRFLFDGESGSITSSGALDYDRKSNYFYSPIGMDTLFRLKASWSLGATGEYDLFWHGLQYSELGDIEPNAVTVKHDQRDGWGARASIKLVKSFGRTDLVVEPYFRYWNIGDSDTAFAIHYVPLYDIYVGEPTHEPPNTTTEWGLKLAIRF